MLIGQHISHYEILEPIGKGGMGEIYKAEDIRLHRQVALKFLPAELLKDDRAKQRFFREAQAASALDHPNICNIHDIDETADGRVFICMASYDGQTLEEKLQEGPIEFDEALDIARQIATGLSEAHRAGIIHRDIKPANILITKQGLVKILDFGLAKLADGTRLTRTGTPLGTPAYMAPEQILGEPLDLRTDIWSFGLVLYEMLTGVNPFLHEYEQATIYHILNKTPEPVSAKVTDIPQSIQKIIDKSLQKDAEHRYATFDAICEDLECLEKLDAPSIDETYTVPDKISQVFVFNRKSVLYLIGSVVAFILLIVFSWYIRETILTEKGASALPQEKQLAILAFKFMGDDANLQALCAGLTELVNSRLTQLGQYRDSFWVVPSSEVSEKNITSAEEARKEFSVNLAITGTLQFFAD
ncbi:MAG TPA: serine/threonine-protein kinase, partial [bacterium]|nr:serine/threonine-protein kinase [bacterium]